MGSLGIPGDIGRGLKRYRFHDVGLGRHVDLALRAIAIDEKRAAFAPSIWSSGDGVLLRGDQVVEQVWFPGVHSNVGGSYPNTGLSDIALDWMIKRVRKFTDLEFDDGYLHGHCKPSAEGIGYESRTALYLGSKSYPYQRLIHQNLIASEGFGGWVRDRYKRMDRRNLVPHGCKTVNERIHQSALDRWALPTVSWDVAEGSEDKRPYRPDNLKVALEAKNVPIVGWDGEPAGGNGTGPEHTNHAD